MSGRRGVSVLPREAEALQGEPAGLVSRSLAAAIDVLVVMTVLLGSYAALSAVLFLVNARTFSFPAPPRAVTLTAAATGAIAYLTIGWWVAGRTYGCAVMGLRVVGRQGRNLRFVPALARAVLCLVFPVGLAWCALDARARALHDLLLRTHVIYDWRRQQRLRNG